MPHIDITMIPGRDDTAKKEIAVKVQQFLAKELNIDENSFQCRLKMLQRKNGTPIWNA